MTTTTTEPAGKSNPAFVKAFLPGLVIGIIVGGFAGAFLPPMLARESESFPPPVAISKKSANDSHQREIDAQQKPEPAQSTDDKAPQPKPEEKKPGEPAPK